MGYFSFLWFSSMWVCVFYLTNINAEEKINEDKSRKKVKHMLLGQLSNLDI